MAVTYDWNINIDKGSACSTVGFAFSEHVRNLVAQGLPELKHLFPFRNHGFVANIHIQDRWFIFHCIDEENQFPRICSFEEKPELLEAFIAKVPLREYTFQELCRCLDAQHFDFKTFSYIGKLENGNASWPLLAEFIRSWLNTLVLPNVLELNEKAIRIAIPDAPTYSNDIVTNGIVILECETTCKQGTGFFLKDFGLVTCSHVLGKDTKAILPSEPFKQYDVRVLSKNDDLDLAILQVDSIDSKFTHQSGVADSVKQMDHLLVCGFPNYQRGDPCFMNPGIITGFRMKSGIRRILTNAAIVKGNSGGPVFDCNSNVIGIAVTGSDSLTTAQETENHGIIPVEALKLVGR